MSALRKSGLWTNSSAAVKATLWVRAGQLSESCDRSLLAAYTSTVDDRRVALRHLFPRRQNLHSAAYSSSWTGYGDCAPSALQIFNSSPPVLAPPNPLRPVSPEPDLCAWGGTPIDSFPHPHIPNSLFPHSITRSIPIWPIFVHFYFTADLTYSSRSISIFHIVVTSYCIWRMLPFFFPSLLRSLILLSVPILIGFVSFANSTIACDNLWLDHVICQSCMACTLSMNDLNTDGSNASYVIVNAFYTIITTCKILWKNIFTYSFAWNYNYI